MRKHRRATVVRKSEWLPIESDRGAVLGLRPLCLRGRPGTQVYASPDP